MRSLRELTVSGCLLVSLASQGQTPAAGSNWQRVQQLPPHTKVHVSADTKGRLCSIDNVDESHLTCSMGRMLQTSHYTFERSEIKSIKLTRYPRSILVGAGIGAGAGAITGLAINQGSSNSFIHFSNGAVAGVAALIFAVPGALIGLGTDFARGPTVYRR